MSTYTQLSLTWDDADRVEGSLELNQVLDAARTFCQQQGLSEDAVIDLEASCKSELLGPPGFKRATSFFVIELIRSVSERFPDVTFYAKGAGEEFWDIWFREFRAGAAVREKGPFEEFATPIPDEQLAELKAAYAEALAKQSATSKPRRGGWLSRFFGDA